jgi:hypothetical protein
MPRPTRIENELVELMRAGFAATPDGEKGHTALILVLACSNMSRHCDVRIFSQSSAQADQALQQEPGLWLTYNFAKLTRSVSHV